MSDVYMYGARVGSSRQEAQTYDATYSATTAGPGECTVTGGCYDDDGAAA